MGRCSSPRQEWRTTNEVIATLPKQRPHEGSRASNKTPSGLGQSGHLPGRTTTISCTCMPSASCFQPLLRLCLSYLKRTLFLTLPGLLHHPEGTRPRLPWSQLLYSSSCP